MLNEATLDKMQAMKMADMAESVTQCSGGELRPRPSLAEMTLALENARSVLLIPGARPKDFVASSAWLILRPQHLFPMLDVFNKGRQAECGAPLVHVSFVLDWLGNDIKVPKVKLRPVDLGPPLIDTDTVSEEGDSGQIYLVPFGDLHQLEAACLERYIGVGMHHEAPDGLLAVLADHTLRRPAVSLNDFLYAREVLSIYSPHRLRYLLLVCSRFHDQATDCLVGGPHLEQFGLQFGVGDIGNSLLRCGVCALTRAGCLARFLSTARSEERRCQSNGHEAPATIGPDVRFAYLRALLAFDGGLHRMKVTLVGGPTPHHDNIRGAEYYAAKETPNAE